MKINVTLPFDNIANPAEFLHIEAVAQVGSALERAGFDGGNVTDHPCPTGRWLDSGGHHAQDPFVTLSLLAAVTKKLRLQTGILVLPYRNPFIVAKAAASLDVLSGGRFILSVATGYLRSEYSALGVDFEQRNVLFDEAVEVLRGVWSEERFSYQGTGFTAGEVTANPRPPHVPIWMGGNSALTRRRVAANGDGWNPFPATATLARTARTVPLEGIDDLIPMLDHLWAQVEAAGRERSQIDIAFSTGLAGPADSGFDARRELEALDRLAAVGVTWTGITIPGTSIQDAIEAIERYGSEVIKAGA